ncbi:four helix bundle protein [Halomonas sp. S2151]|uniref:four helix bundle protein n=1 Tax=Halomonas sp. S2151 TaxID=579478 RepID=UPI000697BE38|nr:four helix bundle protein [Halomonas sp. S2151]
MQSLAIVERYDQAVAYLYPIIQTMPRRHGRYRDKLLDALLAAPGLIYVAAKPNQVSRIYQVDAALAELRWLLRFFLAAWLGHAQWTDSHNLLRSLAAQHRHLTQEVACSAKTKPPAASSALPTTAA